MADESEPQIPANVDLNWIARHILALRGELRSLHDDHAVTAAIVRRIDSNQVSYRDELAALYQLHAELRRRVEALEGKKTAFASPDEPT
jgi:hypothetical protein